MTARMLVLAAAALIVAGCNSPQPTPTPEPVRGPDYSRPLPPGASALRLITDPSRMPDLESAWMGRDALLRDAIDESLHWFEAPSSKQFFPFEGITHEQARASVAAMGELLDESPDAATFRQRFLDRFDVYESVGYDNTGTVLFTGYYSPIFDASMHRTSEFQYPLYRRPADLVTDPITGQPMGRGAGGHTVSYYTREEIERSNMFAGNELVWLRDPLSAYIIHVNGSAKLRLTDGTVLFVGYNGKTDRPYQGLGASILEEGLLTADGLSLPAIRRMYERDPATIERLILRNENYVFFTEYDGGSWPSGSLGVPVTSEASLATDKKIYPRGGLVLVDTQAVTFSEGKRRFLRFMLDQDTGGAIQAPGRADIFMGIGATAEILAGGQYAEGRLYYFFLKERYAGR